jgi:hypothetical protein
MLKQSFIRMKKVLTILLTVLFVVSLTAVATSAINGDQGTDNSPQSYVNPHWHSGESNVSGSSYWKGIGYEGCLWVFHPSTNQWVWTCYD